jgi:hypothetical protein
MFIGFAGGIVALAVISSFWLIYSAPSCAPASLTMPTRRG